MEMQEQRQLPAPRAEVWRALNDPDILRCAMPGCEEFKETGENEYLASILSKVGPVKARFKFHITLSDVEPPSAYVINAEGQGGAAGFARGSARVSLEAQADDETLLSYSVQARVGGKLAQLGGRLIDGAARKLAGEFFENFAAIVSGEEDKQEGTELQGDDTEAV